MPRSMLSLSSNSRSFWDITAALFGVPGVLGLYSGFNLLLLFMVAMVVPPLRMLEPPECLPADV